MRRYSHPLSICLIFIFFACSLEDQKFISSNTIVYNDTLNTKEYPFKKEYGLFLESERFINDSLKKKNPELIVIDPKFTTPLPKSYAIIENGKELSLKNFLKHIEKNTNESVYCNLEYWVEWDNKLSYVEITGNKGELPNQEFILEIFEQIKFEQKKFINDLPYPRSKVIWFVRINTKNYLFDLISSLFVLFFGFYILKSRKFSRSIKRDGLPGIFKIVLSKKFKLFSGISLLISGTVSFVRTIYLIIN